MKNPGSYEYMCTRNNNFSNRDQKGVVTVVGMFLQTLFLQFFKVALPMQLQEQLQAWAAVQTMLNFHNPKI